MSKRGAASQARGAGTVEEIDGVLVVGAGPVGLLSALKLARAGVRVVVVEALAEVMRSPRAAGYQWPTAKVLASVGVLEDAIEVGVIKRANQFRRPATAAIDSMPLSILDTDGERPFDLQLAQDSLAEIILRHLDPLPNAEVRWSNRLTALSQDADGVTVTVECPEGARRLRTSWTIGADGSHSAVRPALGLSFDGHTWPDRFVATNVYFDFEAYGFAPATFVRDPVNWAIIIKINKDGLWRIAYGERSGLSEQQIRDRVEERYRAILPGDDPYELINVGSYQVHERAASSFRVDRVLLAGDAAHICNPSGGFGLMSGLMDANALAGALIAVIDGSEGDELLDRYAQERRAIFHDIVSRDATEYKRVLTESDPEQMRRDDQRLRLMCSDPEILRRAAAAPQAIAGTFPLD